VGFDDLFLRKQKQYNAEATMADFLVELLFSGLKKVNQYLCSV
jgi:hypothetical protein